MSLCMSTRMLSPLSRDVSAFLLAVLSLQVRPTSSCNLLLYRSGNYTLSADPTSFWLDNGPYGFQHNGKWHSTDDGTLTIGPDPFAFLGKDEIGDYMDAIFVISTTKAGRGDIGTSQTASTSSATSNSSSSPSSSPFVSLSSESTKQSYTKHEAFSKRSNNRSTNVAFGRLKTKDLVKVNAENDDAIVMHATVRSYQKFPAVLFIQKFPKGLKKSATNVNSTISAFPSFRVKRPQLPLPSDFAYLTFGGDFIGDAGKKFGVWQSNQTLADGILNSGPTVLYNGKGHSLVISPYSNFMVASTHQRGEAPYKRLDWGIMGSIEELSAGYEHKTIAFCSDHGVGSALEGWGNLMHRVYREKKNGSTFTNRRVKIDLDSAEVIRDDFSRNQREQKGVRKSGNRSKPKTRKPSNEYRKSTPESREPNNRNNKVNHKGEKLNNRIKKSKTFS